MHSVVGYNTSILTSTSVAIANSVTFKARDHILHIEYLLLEITIQLLYVETEVHIVVESSLVEYIKL